MRDDPDADVAARFCAGDSTAVASLIEKYQEKVRALAYRYVRNSEDAKDVAQVVFARAFERRHTYRGESAFATWLFRIAINMAINHVRSRATEAGRTELKDVHDERAFTHSLNTSKLVAAEVWRRVIDRLDELPPKQRLVFELRLFHELSFEEVGILAGCSEEAAKANYHHAVKALRNLIPAPGS